MFAIGLGASPAAAQTPSVDPDQAYLSADLELYAAAKQYFPSDATDAPTRRIFRLTRDQLDTSVESLLPGLAKSSVKEAMPRDALQTNYEYADILTFNAANTPALSGWIGQIASRVRQNPAVVINCPQGVAADCAQREARAFIVKAFRGDASEEKIAQILKFYLAGSESGGIGQATGDLVEIVLNSPHFLFRKELDINRANRLSPAQLLQSVTYTLADVPPEKLSLSSERANQYLRTGPEASKTIGSIAASKEAREKLMRFFMSWLEVKATSDFTISPQIYPEFNARLAAAMRTETMQFLRAQLSKPTPRLTDITQSTQSFIPKSLEAIYTGQSVSSAASGKLVDLNPAQRLGIFSQPAVLASHSGPTDSRPIKRGVFWVRKVMCMEMEPPPPELHAKLYEMEGATERQRIEQSTSGNACIGCHKVINPFAFFQESYDALGRFRISDNGHPIDTSILIDFLDEDPTKTVTAVDAIKTLTNSMMFKQCFVRQLFRFYMGRQEVPSDDPVLRRMFFEFAYQDKQDILRAVQMLAVSDRIVKRQ